LQVFRCSAREGSRRLVELIVWKIKTCYRESRKTRFSNIQ
jgi:hypothetical protein